MTITQHSSIIDRPDERGSALVGVLLLLMMMSALAAALGVSGQTETLVARNHQSGAQAKAAAEAGLNHAVEVATTYVFEWKANGFIDVDQAVDRLLLGPDGLSGTIATDADNGSLAAFGIPLGTRVAIAGASDAEYEASVMDEDNPNRQGSTRILTDGDAANDEDGNALNDANRKLVIRAVGYYKRDNTSVVLEAIIAPIPLPAIATNSDLDISGNPTISGTAGDVHSNGNLTISGASATVTGDASASGTLNCNSPCSQVQGTPSEGATPVPIPRVRAIDYKVWADFILNSTGQLTQPNGTVLCDASGNPNACRDAYGWSFGPGGWSIGNIGTPLNGTYYVEGPASISGSPGSPALPIQISIIAEGSIEISGNPDLSPDTPELLFVTDGDLQISGGIDTPLYIQGQMLVHEQLKITGNPALAGQLIVEDVPSVDPLVTSNQISGNPVITYNGNLGTGTFSVVSWRDIR